LPATGARFAAGGLRYLTEEPMYKKILSFTICFILFLPIMSFGNDIETRLKALEETLKTQGETIKEQQEIIRQLKVQLDSSKKDQVAKGERATKEVQSAKVETPAEKGQEKNDVAEEKGWKFTGLFGASNLANPNISLVLNTFGYHSSLKKDDLAKKGIPGYTTSGLTDRKGFNIDSAELGFYAPVDPYFNLYATIPISEDGVELEEIYFVTTSLPYGFQVKGGKFKSGFGRINGQHKHVWDFADLPLPYRAFIAGEGITEKGVQLTYLPPLAIYTLFGFEVLQGENETLFGKDARSGPHAFAGFIKNSLDMGDNSTILFGPSVITGSTRTDTVADNSMFHGVTTLLDWETTYKWKPSKNQSFTFQTEYMYRTQHGGLTDNSTGTAGNLKRGQDGLYAQAMYQTGQWRLGARFDMLDLLAKQFFLSGSQTDFGSKPWRATAALDFNPSEFTRLRLQYNYDMSSRRGRANNEVFLQLIFAIGAHGAHAF
jgi:hypothetical protein